jgi:hypothetical protein
VGVRDNADEEWDFHFRFQVSSFQVIGTRY